MTIELTSEIRRYEFYSDSWSFVTNLKTQLLELYTVDPYWDVKYEQSNVDSTSKAWNGGNYATNDAICIINKKNPEMAFTLAVCFSAFLRNTGWGQRWNLHNYQIRTGIKNPGSGAIVADVANTLGEGTNIPFSTTPAQDFNYNNSGTIDVRYNVQWKFTVFTHENYIFINGEYQNYDGYAYPFRLYMGIIDPYEVEDVTIASKNYGIFSHAPLMIHDGNMASHQYYNVGRGVMRSSRNHTEYSLYNFATSSQVTSPGLGNRYFLSPFYIYQPSEGVRGEFYGIRTAVLKDGNIYPDGSVLVVGDKRYYVYHINNQAPPTQYKYWLDRDGAYHYITPYFFDSNMLLGKGQRVMLFELKGATE